MDYIDIKQIELDFDVPYQRNIPTVQGDSGRAIQFNLINGQCQVDLTDEEVKIFGIKPDDKRIFADLEITDAINGTCVLKLTAQMLCVEGIVRCTLVRYKNGERYSSRKFNIEVNSSVADDIDIESTDEYIALNKMIMTISNMDTDNLQSNVNQIQKNKEDIAGLSNRVTFAANGISNNTASIMEIKRQIHFHNNKELLDSITQDDIDRWNAGESTGGSGGTGSGEYAPISHTHTKSQITDFPTKLSQFTNDLPTSSGGTGATKTSALITDFGAVNNSSVTYNASTKTYVGTDCSQAILDAIASGYTKIEFPAGGNFIVNTLIPVNKKVLIEGNGANIYVNPIKGQDHNVFYFKDGSDYSVIRGLKFYSTKAYTVNLNTNVTAKSSNNCAIGVNNNAENIVISDCYAEGYKYFVACSVCKNVIIDNCSGKDNYFSVYTGYNAYNTVISRCYFAEQTETDIYGHVLYLGGASYGVRVEDCYFEALGDDSSNIIKCGADQSEYCTGVVVKNTTMKCRSKASFLYCHAHADVQYENCHMIFTGSSKDAYPRLLQFNNYSNMKFKNCKFELDSIQKFTHTDNSLTDNILLFEDCSFTIKNTVNTYLLFDLTAGAKDFKLVRCTLDYSGCSKAINMLRQALYSLQIINCYIKLTTGSALGYTSAGSVSFTQTQSPKLLIANTTIEMPSGNTTVFFQYVKGSTSASISVLNVALLNGTNSSGSSVLSSSEYAKLTNINTANWN